MNRRAVLIIVIAGALLRIAMLWQAGLWYDENFTLLLVRLPFLRMLQATAGDVHPPLLYLILWPLAQIPNLPPWVIRIPSVLFSIVSLALYPRLLRRLDVPPAVQWIAITLLAVLPMQIHYAQEARMYALMEFLAIIAVLGILEGRAWLIFIGAAGLLYSQNYGTFYVAALGLTLAMVIYRDWNLFRIVMMDAHYRAQPMGLAAMHEMSELMTPARMALRRRWRRMAIALLLAVLVWLPWVPTMLAQMDVINGNYWIFDLRLGGILYEIYKLFWAISLSHPAASLTAMFATFAMLLLGTWYLLSHRPPSWLLILVLAFGPILLALAVSFTMQPVLLFRPLIAVTPFLYLLCAYPLGQLQTLRTRLYAACFIVPLLVAGLFGYYRFNPEQKSSEGTGNMQQGVDYIAAHWRPGDVIVNASPIGWVNVEPYMRHIQYAYPDCSPDFPGSISTATQTAIEIPTRTINDLPPGTRVWYIAILGPVIPDCELDRTEAMTRATPPAIVMSESKLMMSAVWLLEANE